MTVLKPPSFKMNLGTVTFFHNDDAYRVMSIEVKQVTEAPCTFKVELDDRDDRFSKSSPIKEGDSAKIALGYVGEYEDVIEGKVTSVKVQRSNDSRKVFTVEGKDLVQNLKRGRFQRSWENIKDSDVISELAMNASLRAECEATPTVHEYVMQNNVSDFSFIMERAKRNGWTLWCEGKKLICKKPMTGSEVVKLTWDASNVARDSGERVLKKIDFKSSNEKIPKEVTVRYYDPVKKQEIVGKSSEVQGGSMGGSSDALSIVGGEGKEMVITDQPVRSVEEAEQLAFERFNEMAGEFMVGTGSCEGDGKIRAGYLIGIDAVGKEMDGQYYVDECTHTWKSGGGEDDGYVVSFKVRRSGR